MKKKNETKMHGVECLIDIYKIVSNTIDLDNQCMNSFFKIEKYTLFNLLKKIIDSHLFFDQIYNICHLKFFKFWNYNRIGNSCEKDQ